MTPLPSAVDTERALLGGLIQDPDWVVSDEGEGAMRVTADAGSDEIKLWLRRADPESYWLRLDLKPSEALLLAEQLIIGAETATPKTGAGR